MPKILEESIKKNSILVSRNTPVAFVVGAAGFLGSHLTELLLKKGIQVVGVDDCSTGKKEHLYEATKNKNLHFLFDSITFQIPTASQVSLLALELPRLDYAFFVADCENNEALFDRGLKNFLAFIKRNSSFNHSAKTADRPKVVLVSSIDLYDSKAQQDLAPQKQAEIFFAKFSKDYHLNSRIVRLAAVYGPRMHFRIQDPIISLIQYSLRNQLQKENTTLDFTTRALFVDDAIELIAKSVLAGGTAQQILDGALYQPLKVAEVKQILLDPMWYEMKGFTPSQLPPWLTPNLEKTMKELSWHPRKDIIAALRETIAYFKDNSLEVPEVVKEDLFANSAWKDKSLKDGLGEETTPEVRPEEKSKEKKKAQKFNLKDLLFICAGLGLIFGGLLWPAITLSWGMTAIQSDLKSSAQNLAQGEFQQAEAAVNRIQNTVNGFEDLKSYLFLLKRFNIGNPWLNNADQIMAILSDGLEGVRHGIIGSQALFASTKIISGENQASPQSFYEQALLELSHASDKLNFAQTRLADEELVKPFPWQVKTFYDDLKLRIKLYAQLLERARVAAQLLPKITAIDGKKSYLVLIVNNLELRPAGGLIESYARIDFDHGKLANLIVDDISKLDAKLKEAIEPPVELKKDLAIDRYFLKDSNFEPDFPTAARQAEFFYNKEAGELVSGVFALDLSAVKNLLEVVGGVDVSEFSEHVDGKNLFEKVITRAKTNYISLLSSQLFNKTFFLSKQNWPEVIKALSGSLEEKHLLIYLSDPKLLSYAASQNWIGILPRQPEDKVGQTKDFLSIVEANVGNNKANFYLQRLLNLETFFSLEGQINHKLTIKYKNNSSTLDFPGGGYKNRLRLYLPAGTKTTKVIWGEKIITSEFSSYSDYGRAVYSGLIEVTPKEEKTLVVEYSLSRPLSFKDGQASYRLDVMKQPGTFKDPFDWKLSYPDNFKLMSSPQKQGSTQVLITSDLSTDRSFMVSLTK